ncbi:hypothetical protein [Streptomyces sp. NPDC020965]|uniref:hypothetical protein n=1 Tax=Streptomyces sp. NPDC020965 TaxID=3365105 RepID=UPI00379555C0
MLRHDQLLADMAGGDDVSGATARRWRDGLIGLLAVQRRAWTVPATTGQDSFFR